MLKCPHCQREFAVNRDGKIRSHWCQRVIGDSKRLTFATGGEMYIRLDANWMLFGEAERELLCSLIDLLDDYERQHPQEPEQPPSRSAVDPVPGIVAEEHALGEGGIKC